VVAYQRLWPRQLRVAA